jgi:hypothetical protein
MGSVTRRRAASRLVLGLLPGALLLAPLAGQASAAALPDHGSTVRCRYHTNADPNWSFTAQFRRIVVTPPRMLSKSGGRQTVGWQFAVSRLIDEGTSSVSTTTYTSKIQKAVATTTRAAAFDNMRVGVTVPTGDWSKSQVQYRILVTLFWYRANGSVQSTASYLISSSYTYYVNGTWWDDSWNYCPGVVKQWVDGPF